jgi:type IV secretory pathway TrbL component
MNRKLAFTALSLAIVFGSASIAMAAAKKHTDARQAYGSATGKTDVDPRDAYWAKRKGGSDETWCDADAQCNGWNEWLQAVNSGKLKN